MTRRTLIQLIRFAELGLACALVAWFWPVWSLASGIVFFALMMPVLQSECPAFCTSAPSTATVVISSFNGGSCSALQCSPVNGTHVIAKNSFYTPALSCSGGTQYTTSCGLYTSGNISVGWRFNSDGGGNTTIEVAAGNGNSDSVFGADPFTGWSWYTYAIGTAPLDCAASATYTLTLFGQNFNYCNGTAASVQVTI
jgi:hypothetical protein